MLDILGDLGVDSGGKGKSKRLEKYGTKKSKERREESSSRRSLLFFVPFRLSLAPTIHRWGSEDVCWNVMKKR